MTWCARVFGALKVIRVPRNSVGARHFGAHHYLLSLFYSWKDYMNMEQKCQAILGLKPLN
jgi:hypothetical protein